MYVSRPPSGPLRAFVAQLWLADDTDLPPRAEACREHVIPTGAMHLVIRLSDTPLRIYASDVAREAEELGCAVVGGARSTYYVRDTTARVRSVGAMLHPGASLPLLGVPADALAERHTRLAALWGEAATAALRDQLRAERCDERGNERGNDDPLAVFEAALAARLPRLRGVHPVIAHAVARFDAAADVAAVVDETGYSHRRFLTLFRDAVGLAPKRYGRVRRFHHALARAAASPIGWSELAHASGYADQAHLAREFAQLAGITPTAFRQVAPRHPHHVAVQIRSRRGGGDDAQ